MARANAVIASAAPCGAAKAISRRCDARGFTLLEVLVAVSLLALLCLLAFGTLRTAVRATRSGEALIERTDKLRTAQEFLRRQLSHAMPLAFERMEDTGENKVFLAERDSLRFVAPMPGFLARGGPHVQWLAFERGRDGDLRLVFDHAQLNGYDPDNPKGESKREPVVLLEGIERGEFEFRALDESGELGDWTSSWDEPQRMPLLVRLKLEFGRDSRQRWPVLEIPLLTAGYAAMQPYARGLNSGRTTPGVGAGPRPPNTGPRPDGGQQ